MDRQKMEKARQREARMMRLIKRLLRIGFGLILLLLVGGIFYRPLLYWGLVLLIPALLGLAFSSPLTIKDYLAMIWWDQRKK